MKAQLENLNDLENVRTRKMAVICPGIHCFNRPIPAAFVMNMSCEIVNRMLKSGLYIYLKKRTAWVVTP